MNLNNPKEVDRERIAKICRKRRRERLDLRRNDIEHYNSLLLSNKGNREVVAKLRRKHRKDKLDFKRKTNRYDALCYSNTFGNTQVPMQFPGENNNVLCFAGDAAFKGNSAKEITFRRRRQERMKKLKLKRLSVRVCRQKPLIRRGLFSRKKSRSKSKRSNESSSEKNMNVEFDDLIVADIQLSNDCIFGIAELLEYKDIGDMNVCCRKCAAMVWKGETVGKNSDLNPPEISLCCMKGNIVLAGMVEPPSLIRNLFSGVDSSEVAALIVGDFDSTEDGRDIVVRKQDGRLKRIHETHPKYIPLQYPLLFPHGEDQYDEKLKRKQVSISRGLKKRIRVTLREFIAFRLQERAAEDAVLFNSRRLFQQFVVDLYSMIESQRLSFIRKNQSQIRADFLACVEEAVERGDIDGSSIGTRVVIPASFVGVG
ncbi:ATP-dependent DNA helicase PIF1 [Trifolium pratense]|uniref:ATP-dependent DNA helicase PIF1 n=1 Tax=Trifolium pratense TaxID=57577 RepID=A0A2K3L4F2_TRIPR|nr:ATP-dependent DNA helicase PIF1 [Trifolium pratense]